MSYFREWAVSLIMLVAAGGFLQILAPSGDMKKYINFIFAMVILDALISPVELLL